MKLTRRSALRALTAIAAAPIVTPAMASMPALDIHQILREMRRELRKDCPVPTFRGQPMPWTFYDPKHIFVLRPDVHRAYWDLANSEPDLRQDAAAEYSAHAPMTFCGVPIRIGPPTMVPPFMLLNSSIDPLPIDLHLPVRVHDVVRTHRA